MFRDVVLTKYISALLLLSAAVLLFMHYGCQNVPMAVQRTTTSSADILRAVYGRGMNDSALISAVRAAFIPPADAHSPYYMEAPEIVKKSQFGQDALVEKVFRSKKNGYFFEAGALTGERLSNTLYLERNHGWTGVLVEPMPESFHVLATKNRRAHLLNVCLSTDATAGEVVLETDFSSPYLAKIADRKHSLKAVRVPAVPVYSILQALGNPIVDYFSLDIEGHEMKVLKTIPWAHVKIRFIGIEINNLPEGKQAVKEYMEQQNFTFFKLQKIDYFFYKKELAKDMDLT